MSRVRIAAGAAAVAAALLVAVLAWPGGGRSYRAELRSARGLVAGNDVRVAGAIAGRVRSIALTRRGTALVTFSLDGSAPPPRSDASASVRPVDLLGDNYLALDPGRAAAPLQGEIPVARTADAPRLDELLAAFTPDVRSGLRMLLVESGVALDQRGADLGRAAIALRPGLDAAAGVAGELARQNVALSRLVGDAERATGQLARRERDLGPLVDGLDATLRTTAAHAQPLDTTLRGAPALLAGLEATSSRLTRTARAARPVAASLGRAAQPLGEAVAGLPSLAGQAASAAGDLRPAVRRLRALLVDGSPTLRSLAGALAQVRAVAPQTDALLGEAVPAAPLISKGFFVNFADQAAEPGNQPFDPFADPRRAYWRGAAVFSCESFGVPVKPGCLGDLIASFSKTRERPRRRAPALPQVSVPHVSTPRVPALPAAPHLPAVPATPVSPTTKRLLGFLLGS